METVHDERQRLSLAYEHAAASGNRHPASTHLRACRVQHPAHPCRSRPPARVRAPDGRFGGATAASWRRWRYWRASLPRSASRRLIIQRVCARAWTRRSARSARSWRQHAQLRAAVAPQRMMVRAAAVQVPLLKRVLDALSERQLETGRVDERVIRHQHWVSVSHGSMAFALLVLARAADDLPAIDRGACESVATAADNSRSVGLLGRTPSLCATLSTSCRREWKLLRVSSSQTQTFCRTPPTYLCSVGVRSGPDPRALFSHCLLCWPLYTSSEPSFSLLSGCRCARGTGPVDA